MNAMENEAMFLVPKRFLDDIQHVKDSLDQINKKLDAQKPVGEKLYYIAQVAKMLGKSHKTVTLMVKSGVIRSTANGLIPESAIEEFLNGR